MQRTGCTLSLQLLLTMHQDLVVKPADFFGLDLWWQLANQARVPPLIRQRDARRSKRRHDRIQLVT